MLSLDGNALDQASSLRALIRESAGPTQFRLIFCETDPRARALTSDLALALSESAPTISGDVILEAGIQPNLFRRGRLRSEDGEFGSSAGHVGSRFSMSRVGDGVRSSQVSEISVHPILVLPSSPTETEAAEFIDWVLSAPLSYFERGLGVIVTGMTTTDGLERYRSFARAIPHPTRRLALRYFGSVPEDPAAVAAFESGQFLLDLDQASRWGVAVRLIAERLCRWIQHHGL